MHVENAFIRVSLGISDEKRQGDKRHLFLLLMIMNCRREGRDFAWPKSGDISRKRSSLESQNRLNVPITMPVVLGKCAYQAPKDAKDTPNPTAIATLRVIISELTLHILS